MATPPLTYLEKKWVSGVSYANDLILGATQTTDRRNIAMQDRDLHRSISPMGRRTLLTLGQWLYWNVSAVRGTINEMADLSVQSFIPQFEGADQNWGGQVEDWMREHDKICDVRGWPFSMAMYRKNLVRGCLVQGELGTLLTSTSTGYPMIQVIPSHRIGSRFGSQLVEGGQFDGARIIDGVIVDDLGRAIGYRILGEASSYNFSDYVDVPARDFFVSFLVHVPEQCRGISELGASCFDWQDAADARRFELLSQKLNSSLGFSEYNESGEADRTKKMLQRTSANFDDSGNSISSATETIDGISVRYFRAGSGSKIEAHRNDRPTANQQAFRDDVIREALHGIGWSMDFSLNPTKIGGAPMRVVVDRLNRKLDAIRKDVVQPAQVRVDGYRVAKVMDNPQRADKQTVLFPFNADWFRWSYQGPPVLTADAKYNSDVNVQERRAGMKTLAKSAAEAGDYWRDVREQEELEADDLLERAGRLAAKHGVTIDYAVSLLEKLDQSPSPAASEPPAPAGNAADNATEAA